MESTKCLQCGKNSTLQTTQVILPQAELRGGNFVENGKGAFVFKVYICDECNHVDLESIPAK